MRVLALAALPALVLLACVPSAAAARELPAEAPVGVRVHHDERLPGEDNCYDCTGATVVVGAGFTQCCDMPWFSIGATALTGDGDGTTEARVFACYAAFVGVCFVDETVTVPVG